MRVLLDENAALIAEHCEAAGDLRAAFDWHMRAGAWSNNRDVTAARVSWERARGVADALPDDDPGPHGDAHRAAHHIVRNRLASPRRRFRYPLRGTAGAVRARRRQDLAGLRDHGAAGGACAARRAREAQRLASELIALLDSIGDPALTAQAGFGAIGIKAQAGEMGEVLRWAEATIEWADGDPAKGNLVVGSPLALALALRGLARSWFGRPGWREDHDDAIAFAEQSADPLTLTVDYVMGFRVGDVERSAPGGRRCGREWKARCGPPRRPATTTP